ncbi:F-box domain-containing protein [Artemisia annua]|uniref:F-box domain-containing protein n=1 Tax=Artemisia annua TaxID=35608 RepID=A0A2U1LLX8_ARTAN|nr:F-box domain-containing protein [Artemisia annua]
MDVLPSNIILDIFSRVPAKCLARSRCVSKGWCKYINDRYLVIIHDQRVKEEPIPILYHFHCFSYYSVHSLCYHVVKSKRNATRRYNKKARVGTKQTGTAGHTYMSELKEDSFLEFLRKKPLSESSDVKIEVLGSCNGLMCLSQYEEYAPTMLNPFYPEDYAPTPLVVVHPLRKECYELPPLPMRFDKFTRGSCGLGFDSSTNTLKMVFVLHKHSAPACALVHVFGTNSWREIPKVPSYPIRGKAIFVNGCLHWLVSDLDFKAEHGGRNYVTWFDVEKEEFGLIESPKRMCDVWRNYSCDFDHLVDLNGEVGFVCASTMDVWVLKQKEWIPHYRFEKKRVPNGDIEVLGCWNKDGDILIRNTGRRKYEFFVYNLKSGVRHKTNIVVPFNGCQPNIFMHPNKLISTHGIGTNSFPVKKADFKRSCQHSLSCY